MTGTEGAELQTELINQVCRSLWVLEGTSDAARSDLILAAASALKGMKPNDEIEGMLASQMVATHSAAMECLRRAMLRDQTFAGRDQNLKHATKLLSIYTRQIETLNKHRGKGQQKMTIEYVNVEAGGQAVVGNVNANKGPQSEGKSADPSAKAISHNPGEVIGHGPEATPQKIEKKHRKARR